VVKVKIFGKSPFPFNSPFLFSAFLLFRCIHPTPSLPQTSQLTTWNKNRTVRRKRKTHFTKKKGKKRKKEVLGVAQGSLKIMKIAFSLFYPHFISFFRYLLSLKVAHRSPCCKASKGVIDI
jgi:hypothetical protein